MVIILSVIFSLFFGVSGICYFMLKYKMHEKSVSPRETTTTHNTQITTSGILETEANLTKKSVIELEKKKYTGFLPEIKANAVYEKGQFDTSHMQEQFRPQSDNNNDFLDNVRTHTFL